VDSETVTNINQNIAASSDRFIMGPAQQELETVVALSGCTAPYATARVTFERYGQTDDESFGILTVNPRNYFYLPDGHIP
jgi:hypothetical protein